MAEGNEFRIPIEILEKYHVYTGFIESDPLGTYQTFLLVTDYKITKLYEAIAMDYEHAAQLTEEFKENESELVKYRRIAREELSKALEDLDNQAEE